MDLSQHHFIVETDWLADNLEQPTLRIIECTSLLPNYFEESASEGLKQETGRTLYDEGHIPGSAFADLLGDLSDQSVTDFMYAMPSAKQFSEVMSALGVGEGTGVILYDRRVNMWAARIWWMLRSFGFTNAAVLNGGWEKWQAEGRPISTDAASYPPAKFNAVSDEKLIADKARVLAATRSKTSTLINALDPDEFAGRPPHRYDRPGRIPNSVNVPFTQTADPETQHYLADTEVKEIFDKTGAMQSDEVICYCGGGIAACNTALLLTRLGHENVAVYDGSMMEWSADSSLPMETG